MKHFRPAIKPPGSPFSRLKRRKKGEIGGSRVYSDVPTASGTTDQPLEMIIARARSTELIEHAIQCEVKFFGRVVVSAGDLAAQFGDAIDADFTTAGYA